LKVTFESKITCQAEVDYLRCSPKHYNEPRYDCVLVQTTQGVMFAQLVFLFNFFIADKPHPVALVQTLRRELGDERTRRKDHELGFLRLRQQCFEFIWARTILRGVPIFPAFDNDRDSIVFDIIDADMALRVQDILNE
jgi:hypothetical protein